MRSQWLPEPGWWMLALNCAGVEEPVLPSFVDLTPEDTDVYVHLIANGVDAQR